MIWLCVFWEEYDGLYDVVVREYKILDCRIPTFCKAMVIGKSYCLYRILYDLENQYPIRKLKLNLNSKL